MKEDEYHVTVVHTYTVFECMGFYSNQIYHKKKKEKKKMLKIGIVIEISLSIYTHTYMYTHSYTSLSKGKCRVGTVGRDFNVSGFNWINNKIRP